MINYTCDEAAYLLDLSGQRIRQLCASGELKASKHGWAWVIPKESVERYKALRGDADIKPTD